MFVKPANLGSSVGISKAKSDADFLAGDGAALQFDRKVVIEAAVPNAREIECAVLGNDDPSVGPRRGDPPTREFYDYDAKYLDADGSRDADSRRRSTAKPRAVRRLSDRGLPRRRAAPGWRASTSCSTRRRRAVPQRGQHHPRVHDDQHVSQDVGGHRPAVSALLDRLIALALERHAEKQRLRTSVT